MESSSRSEALLRDTTTKWAECFFEKPHSGVALNPSLAMTTQRGVQYLEVEMLQPLLTWHRG